MVDCKKGNGCDCADIRKKIQELEDEVAELRPNGSCKQVRREADELITRIQELRQQQEI